MSYMFGYCCRSEPVRNEYKVFRAFQISLWLWKSLFKHFTDFTDFAISFQSPRFDILNLWGSYEEMVYMWEKQCYYNMRWKMRKCCGKWRSNQVNMLWICYFETLDSFIRMILTHRASTLSRPEHQHHSRFCLTILRYCYSLLAFYRISFLLSSTLFFISITSRLHNSFSSPYWNDFLWQSLFHNCFQFNDFVQYWWGVQWESRRADDVNERMVVKEVQ